MNQAERNYNIWDKEMLAIVRALDAWRHYLIGLPKPFEIQTNHKNLEYWQMARNLTRRQARWSLFLSEFRFMILYQKGSENGRADPLSQRPDIAIKDDMDNQNQIILKPDVFWINAARRGYVVINGETALLDQIRKSNKEVGVAEAIKKVKQLGPVKLQKGIEEWNTENGLLLHRGKIYIPKDKQLCNNIIQRYHNSLAAGHPGRHKTLELVTRNYWWPGITKSVNKYISSYMTCLKNKKTCSLPMGPLLLLPIPTCPWEYVTANMIVKLPQSNGYDSILVVVDQFSKMAHFIPTNETITAIGIVKLYLDNIFWLYGLPKE
jgi:hypothetical protein